mgnify:CR=1 FL=1
MHINFSSGSIESEPEKYSRKVIIIGWANHKNHKLYFDVTEDEAKDRFELYMNDRTWVETDMEGWDAIVNIVYMKDNELTIETNAGEVFKAFTDVIGLTTALCEVENHYNDKGDK